MFILSMLLLVFSFQFLFFFYLISSVFLNNTGKSSDPFMEILFPHDKFLHGKTFPLYHLPQQKKHPLKTFLYFLIPNTRPMCKQ